MINTGPWRCAAAEAATSATSGLPGGIQPLRRHHDGWELVPPTSPSGGSFQNDSDGGRFGALRRASDTAEHVVCAFREPTDALRGLPLPGRQATSGRLRPRHRRRRRAAEAIAELLASERFAAFSPDTLDRGAQPRATARTHRRGRSTPTERGLSRPALSSRERATWAGPRRCPSAVPRTPRRRAPVRSASDAGSSGSPSSSTHDVQPPYASAHGTVTGSSSRCTRRASTHSGSSASNRGVTPRSRSVQISFDSIASSSAASVMVATRTTSAQPSMVIGSPTGAACARSIQWRYGSFRSSAFWCSAVG